jgi:hypothetical protein
MESRTVRDGDKEEAGEAFLELHRGLIDSKWPLTNGQFGFFARDTKERIKALIDELEAVKAGDDLKIKWEELNRLEEERLKLTRILENVSTRIVPRIDTKHTETGDNSGKFSHISESCGEAVSLVSYVRLDKLSAFGVILNTDVLAQKLLPPDPKKIRMREGWYLQVTDESGKIVAGQDVSALQPPPPELTFTGAFPEGFPMWKGRWSSPAQSNSPPGISSRQNEWDPRTFLPKAVALRNVPANRLPLAGAQATARGWQA